ncbi:MULTISPECIES: hypothetical protein [Kitasatospora]|uniref:hypothetical protein n=1 Tax=Kitasatospora TaxID=2063 RepID=UPI00059E8B84|nr:MULTISPECIES: hypothetical protein [Kitasatospora]
MAKAPAPPGVLYAKGIPSRVHMPAQMAAEAARLLTSASSLLAASDAAAATRYAEVLRELLRPRCGYGYEFRGRRSTAIDGCMVEVAEPGMKCEEHGTWPRLDGRDPDPQRCQGVPLTGKGTLTWVSPAAPVRVWGRTMTPPEAGGHQSTRCPYPRREGGPLCALHDPRPDELCGFVESADEEPCAEVVAYYGCREHTWKIFSKRRTEIELSVPCPLPSCQAPAGKPCRSSRLHVGRTKVTSRAVEELNRVRPSCPDPRVWTLVEMAPSDND